MVGLEVNPKSIFNFLNITDKDLTKKETVC